MKASAKKLKKRVFCGFNERFPHPRFRAQNGYFLYNGFNGQFNSIHYNNHKLMSGSQL